ncbi:MAG: tetratricopeptide repeat protein [Ignavibacteria bacterium]|nr:tetratricopeptide repeat protein [Ignavibacteria bacterium]
MQYKKIIILVLFVAASVIAQDMKPDAAKLYNDGNQKMKVGNFSGAIQSYDQALQIEKDYRIYYQKGIAHKKSNQLDESYNSLIKCAEMKSDFDLVYNALGSAEFSRGNYEEASDYFVKLLSITKNAQLKKLANDNLSLSYTKLGDLAIRGGEQEKAISFLDKAVKHDDSNGAAHLALAKAFVESGKYNDALSAADAALKSKAKISKGGVNYYKGLALKNLGKLSEAKSSFEEGKKDPTYRTVCDYEIKNLPKN